MKTRIKEKGRERMKKEKIRKEGISKKTRKKYEECRKVLKNIEGKNEESKKK